jgi:hypothetical protein
MQQAAPSHTNLRHVLSRTARFSRRAKIRRALRRLRAVNRQCYEALHAEWHLPRFAWHRLFKRLEHDHSPVEDVLLRWAQRTCLRGTPCKIVTSSSVLAYPVTLDTFAESLQRQMKAPLPRDVITQHILFMLDSSIDALKHRWAEYHLRPTLLMVGVVAAFAASDQTIAPSDAALRGCLCPATAAHGDPFLVLHYQLPDSIASRIPTVADALAEDLWCVFVSADRDAQIGDLSPRGNPTTRGPQHPRGVVHEPVTGRHLCAPLRQVH